MFGAPNLGTVNRTPFPRVPAPGRDAPLTEEQLLELDRAYARAKQSGALAVEATRAALERDLNNGSLS